MKKRTVLVNFSGGKDSTVAILEAMKHYPKDEIVLCFQNTGAEYLETPGHVRLIADTLSLPLVTIYPPRDFWAHIKYRRHFPTPDCRTCRDMLKREPANHWIRSHRAELGQELVVVMGTRAEESTRRAALPEREPHRTTLQDGSFHAETWYPCLRMSEREIYERIRAEGLPLHSCYEFSKRCSCWCCIYQHPNVVREYAERQPALYEQACQVEAEIGHRWRDGLALGDLMRQLRLPLGEGDA